MEKSELCQGTEMTFESVDNDTDEEGFWKKWGIISTANKWYVPCL